MLKNLALKTLIPILFLISGLILIFAFYIIVIPAAKKETYEFAEKQSRLLMQSHQGRLDTLLSSGNETRIGYDIFFAAADERIKMILVIDEKNTIQYAHRSRLVGETIDNIGIAFSRDLIDTTTKYGTISVDRVTDQSDLIAAYAGLTFVTPDNTINRWTLIIVEDYGTVLDHITSIVTFPSELLATFFIIIGTGLVAILGLRLRKRLTPLLDSAAAIANGNTNVRSNLSGQDEFAELSMAFDHMAEQFENQQKQLKIAKDTAEKANRTKTLFLAGISHEIRTPLTNIIGFLELIDQPTTNADDIKLFSQSAKVSADTLLGLIEDIMQFSKLDSGEIIPINEPFCLNLLVQTIVEPYTQQLSENFLDIRIESESDEPIWIESDYRIIRQILMNLLSNAIKFTLNGTITVGLGIRDKSEHNSIATIWVEDSGIGMKPSLRSEIEDFLNRPQDKQYEDALGLGVSICKQLSSLLNGQWTIESIEGEGSKFTLEIETTKAAPQTELSFKDINIHQQNQLNILIVDDHTVNRLLIQSIVEKWGHSVTCVDSGPEAIEAVKATLIYPDKPFFDVCLLDINMPNMNGYETIQNIRTLSEKTARLPSIAITANVSEQDRTECLKHEIEGFVPKPIDTENLAAELFRVTHILETNSKRQ
ncbi:response regulator [Kordiimonas sp. SCSIO 12610]|uniref:response regulator n=1 Tax=Kordiimonas sp. SCSIO 12610 TaxID=2829597 RepID=UPI00210969EA|nr:response regulator [Kordiimonas sp. SCSIO 12610]UTW54985.1 response regulator [Kordiimonas sp. SCSIO 12610]